MPREILQEPSSTVPVPTAAAALSPAPAHITTLPTGINLAKLAADHSDAIIFGSDNIPQELADYCSNCGLPVLPFNAGALEDGSYVEEYNNFYDQL